jgi:RNA polymerase sigma factor (TIGR02999 family)
MIASGRRGHKEGLVHGAAGCLTTLHPAVIIDRMSEVTHILDAIAQGDPQAAGRLLPLVYEELRRLAAGKLAHEAPGQTLQATALVHEAYLRLTGDDPARPWNGRGHFFAAAAEAMRRILIEKARRRQRVRHGGGRQRIDLDEALDLHQPAHAGRSPDSINGAGSS